MDTDVIKETEAWQPEHLIKAYNGRVEGLLGQLAVMIAIKMDEGADQDSMISTIIQTIQLSYHLGYKDGFGNGQERPYDG